jgi:hypothetical protein
MVPEAANAPPEVALMRAVRGELAWRDLSEFGIAVRVTQNDVEAISGLRAPVRATAEDIAWGWLRTSKNECAFREWARFVHGAIALIEIDVEGHPLGELVLGALWDAAFGEQITPEMTHLMRKVVSSDSA